LLPTRIYEWYIYFVNGTDIFSSYEYRNEYYSSLLMTHPLSMLSLVHLPSSIIKYSLLVTKLNPKIRKRWECINMEVYVLPLIFCHSHYLDLLSLEFVHVVIAYRSCNSLFLGGKICKYSDKKRTTMINQILGQCMAEATWKSDSYRSMWKCCLLMLDL
jgi:hypothetical protein